MTASPGDDLLDLLGGKHRAQALSTAAALGVADHLAAHSPQTATDLASAIGCDADDLRSLLQLLAGLGYLACLAPDCYQLSPHGRMLCRDRLGPLAAFVGAPEQWDPWSRLRDAMCDRALDRRPAFERATGQSLYAHLAADAAAAARYDAAIDSFTAHEATQLEGLLDLGSARTVIDVGGGRGRLLLHLLRRWPHLRGILFDLPHVARAAAADLEAACPGRAFVIDGDFFHDVPADGDVYLLKHVLHNWSDERARQVLALCATRMATGGLVVAIEAVLAPDTRPDLARILDLEMRVLTGGRERRKPELRRLFAAAGLALTRVEPLTRASWMLVGRRYG